jgi:DNA-binding MarR family transcriptional regulator
MDEMRSPQRLKAEPIENQVLVALRRIIRSIDMHSRTLVKHYGLTGPQLVILKEISKHHEISPGHLAKEVSLSQATITGITERLAKRGFIVRRRSENDRRKVLLSITQEAERMLDSGPPIMQVDFVEAFNRLKDWEQSMILSSLQHLVNLMDAEAVDAAPILTTAATVSPTEEFIPDPLSDLELEQENGKNRR